MICEIDGLVLGGVQFGVLASVLFWGVTVRAYFFAFLHLDGRTQEGIQFGVLLLMVLR